jgi:hypothetical protein
LIEKSIRQLLQLAGAPPSDEKAAAWLNEAITGARASLRIAAQRPLPADHNELLADIEKSAKELTTRIHRLRRHPVSWNAYWRSGVFGPVRFNRVEVREVLSAVQKIVRAADTAKVHHQGRRRDIGKQQVVDWAFAFFVRYSPDRPSGTPTGAFARFARAFYSAVTELDMEHGLDRQIRQAVTRLPVERQRVQRKSVEKLRDPS